MLLVGVDRRSRSLRQPVAVVGLSSNYRTQILVKHARAKLSTPVRLATTRQQPVAEVTNGILDPQERIPAQPRSGLRIELTGKHTLPTMVEIAINVVDQNGIPGNSPAAADRLVERLSLDLPVTRHQSSAIL